MKTCRRCKVEKSPGDFHRRAGNRDGMASYCKPCSSEYNRLYRQASPEKVHARRIFRTYGITGDEYVAMLAAQNGGCAVCGGQNTQPNRERVGGTRRMHVDHDHTTGAVRGLLCNHCNAALGHVGDSAERLRALIAYLEMSR